MKYTFYNSVDRNVIRGNFQNKMQRIKKFKHKFDFQMGKSWDRLVYVRILALRGCYPSANPGLLFLTCCWFILFLFLVSKIELSWSVDVYHASRFIDAVCHKIRKHLKLDFLPFVWYISRWFWRWLFELDLLFCLWVWCSRL